MPIASSISATRPALDFYTAATPPGAPSGQGLAPRDRVTLSEAAQRHLAGGAVGSPLTEDQQRQVKELQQRDQHVRAHEAAHRAAGGDLTGPASFTYQQGPDGRSYAVGGEVQVQSRGGLTPDETIAVARRVRAAALAPGDPSAADLAAAASASQVERAAEQQKRAQAGQAAGPAAPARPA